VEQPRCICFGHGGDVQRPSEDSDEAKRRLHFRGAKYIDAALQRGKNMHDDFPSCLAAEKEPRGSLAVQGALQCAPSFFVPLLPVPVAFLVVHWRRLRREGARSGDDIQKPTPEQHGDTTRYGGT
jgi:hypothetical protein